MRERVLRETVNCIFDLGLQNTSTVEITKRAGISRGAMLHHYPAKEDLLCAAYEKVLAMEVEQLRDVAGDYAEGEVTLDDFVDYLWSRFIGQSFPITLDFVAAARTNERLRGRVEKARRNYHESLDKIWSQFFVDEEFSDRDARVKLNLTLCLFRGMGFQFVMQSDREEFDALVEEWKQTLKVLLAS